MQKRGIGLILVVIILFSSSLVLAEKVADITYSNGEITPYYGLAIFKDEDAAGDEVSRVHQFVTSDNFPVEFTPPINALLAMNEQLLFDVGERHSGAYIPQFIISYLSFTIEVENIFLNIKGDAQARDEEGECT